MVSLIAVAYPSELRDIAYVYVGEEKPIKGLINTHGSFELLPSNGPIRCVLHSAALTKLAAKDRHLVDDPSLKVYI